MRLAPALCALAALVHAADAATGPRGFLAGLRSVFLRNPQRSAREARLPPTVGELAKAERVALVELYERTRGRAWIYSSNWLRGCPCRDNWAGVTCGVDEETGRLTVIRLELHANNLEGDLPDLIDRDALAARSQARVLAALHLRANNLPPELANEHLGELLTEQPPSALPNLRVLDLHWNSLTGPIPLGFAAMKKLERLNLENNSLEGTIPAAIGKMTSLKTLKLNDNPLGGEFPQIQNLARLETLILDGCGLTGPLPAWIGELKSLRKLSVAFNNLTSTLPESICELENLEQLVANSNRLSGELRGCIAALAKLATVHLNRNAFTGPIPDDFAKFRALKVLYLDHNRLTSLPEGLADLQAPDGRTPAISLGANGFLHIPQWAVEHFPLAF